MQYLQYDDSTQYTCAFCGEPNEIDIDLSAGRQQRYVEDCQVCCNPNVLYLHYDHEGQASVHAEPES